MHFEQVYFDSWALHTWHWGRFFGGIFRTIMSEIIKFAACNVAVKWVLMQSILAIGVHFRKVNMFHPAAQKTDFVF